MSDEEIDLVAEQQERDLQSKLSIVTKWKEMIELKAFKEFMRIAQEQVTGRTDEIVLTPMENFLEGGKQEFMKGEVAGIKLFMQIPATVINNLEAEIAQMRAEINDE